MSVLAVTSSPRVLFERARYLSSRPHEWPVVPRFEPTRRWYARIAADEHAEAWLLSWLPGQHTDWHDHGESAGAFVVVAGRVTEEVLGCPGRHFDAGSGRGFGVRHVHRVANTGPEPAVTLHVYAPALTSMTRYELVAGALHASEVQRAGSAW
jgi:mannose-6-phosphate isomerase-like protein (cupin superfamily)